MSWLGRRWLFRGLFRRLLPFDLLERATSLHVVGGGLGRLVSPDGRLWGWTFPADIELEYKIPEGSNAVAEVKKCVEFCRESLA